MPRRSFVGRAIRAQSQANWEWVLVVPVIIVCLGLATAVGLGWLVVLNLGVLLSRDRSPGADARYARTMASSLLLGMLFMLVIAPTRTLIARDLSPTDTAGV